MSPYWFFQDSLRPFFCDLNANNRTIISWFFCQEDLEIGSFRCHVQLVEYRCSTTDYEIEQFFFYSKTNSSRIFLIFLIKLLRVIRVHGTLHSRVIFIISSFAFTGRALLNSAFYYWIPKFILPSFRPSSRSYDCFNFLSSLDRGKDFNNVQYNNIYCTLNYVSKLRV